MPPKRTRSSLNSVEKEGRVLLAVKHIQSHLSISQREAAEIFDIPRSTLARRLRGTLFRNDIRPTSHKLTQLEEDSLVE